MPEPMFCSKVIYFKDLSQKMGLSTWALCIHDGQIHGAERVLCIFIKSEGYEVTGNMRIPI